MANREAKKLGGSDDKRDFRVRDTENYCDKGGHRERSIANQPSHQRHWNKISNLERRQNDSQRIPL